MGKTLKNNWSGSSLTEYKNIISGKNEKYGSLKSSDYVLLPVWKFADAFKQRRKRMGKLTGFMIKGKTSVLFWANESCKMIVFTS